MSAIRVSQSPRRVVVLGIEERCVGVVASVVIEQAVHGPEQCLRLIEGQRRLAPQAGLQIRHQQSGGDSLARNIANDQRQPLRPEIQEIEVVPSYLSRLQADTCVLHGFQLRLNLRKQPCLHFLAISSSCATRRSDSSFSACSCRRNSRLRLTSSNPSSPKAFPSGSSKRV